MRYGGQLEGCMVTVVVLDIKNKAMTFTGNRFNLQ
jgi:hypothetical protein